MPLCTYCGAYDGNTKDHIIPLAYSSISRKVNVGETVPSCNECNTTLGSRMFFTVPERAGYVYRRYSEKYDKLRCMPDWSETELATMSKNMSKKIRTALRKRDYIEERLEHLYVVTNGFEDQAI